MFQFNARMHEPGSGFVPLPAGDYPVVIRKSNLTPTKDKQGGMLVLQYEVIDGPHRGKIGIDRLNLFNANPQTVDIANRHLSAICHVLGIYDVQGQEVQDNAVPQLHNQPFVIRATVSTNKETGQEGNNFSNIRNMNGQAPTRQGGAGQAPGGYPQGPQMGVAPGPMPGQAPGFGGAPQGPQPGQWGGAPQQQFGGAPAPGPQPGQFGGQAPQFGGQPAPQGPQPGAWGGAPQGGQMAPQGGPAPGFQPAPGQMAPQGAWGAPANGQAPQPGPGPGGPPQGFGGAPQGQFPPQGGAAPQAGWGPGGQGGPAPQNPWGAPS